VGKQLQNERRLIMPASDLFGILIFVVIAASLAVLATVAVIRLFRDKRMP
jgi:hypothetical protein